MYHRYLPLYHGGLFCFGRGQGLPFLNCGLSGLCYLNHFLDIGDFLF